MDIFLSFAIAFIFSFIGSIQLGPVNMHVIQMGLHQKTKSGIYLAIGGCIPEIIYSSIALWGFNIIHQYQSWMLYMNYIVIIVFCLLALWHLYLYIKNTKKSIEPKSIQFKFPFFKGLILAMLNPQLITFWLMIIAISNETFKINILSNLYNQIAFCMGTAIGALAILLLILKIVLWKQAFLQKIIGRKMDLIMSFLFFTLSIILLFKVCLD